jgi:hypothetical protein
VIGLLLAFSLGVFPDQGARQVVRVVVRDEGVKPRPFIFQIRTKADRSDKVPWEYLPPESLQYFPSRLLTSQQGRVFTVRIPAGLKQFSQVCALSEPKAEEAISIKPDQPVDGPAAFSLRLSLQSCQNLPKPK